MSTVEIVLSLLGVALIPLVAVVFKSGRKVENHDVRLDNLEQETGIVRKIDTRLVRVETKLDALLDEVRAGRPDRQRER